MRTIIAANWKMYKTRTEAGQTARDLLSLAPSVPAHREVIVFAPFTALDVVATSFGGTPFQTGAQDVYPAAEGAFTGEISPAMIRDAGGTWILAGHSERRHLLGEADTLVGQKTAFALANGLSVILCVGETLQEREAGDLENVLRRQLDTGLHGVEQPDPAHLAIAYEPVWAIGTGKVASSADILEAHSLVRTLLGQRFGSPAGSIAILYGGSVKPDNASTILALDNVNGLLVGGASLQATSFSQIVSA